MSRGWGHWGFSSLATVGVILEDHHHAGSNFVGVLTHNDRPDVEESALSIRLLCRLTSPIMIRHRQQHTVYVMDERPIPAGKKQGVEPEIIPPDGAGRRSRSSAAGIRVFIASGDIRHIYVARLGTLGLLVLALMIGILFAIMLVLMLGAFLIWIPLVGLLVAAAIIFGLLRAFFRQPR